MRSELLVEGTIHTQDPACPRAGAVLIREGVVACVGTPAECAAAARAPLERLALGAGSAVPGLADAHGHVLWYARAREEVACGGLPDAAACAARVAERARATSPGAWIRGRGWAESGWPGARLPDAAQLDRAAPRNPVLLVRVDGHAAWVNGLALAAAGIGPETADPPGGRIVRDDRGHPTGVLVDGAMELVARLLPRPGAEELERLLCAGLEALARLGLSAVHDAGVEPDALQAYRRLAEAGRLPIRVHAMLDGQAPLPQLEEELRRWARWVPAPAGNLTVRTVKVFADGALGSRGAALLEDYADEPGNRGLLLLAPEALRARISAAAAAGFQPAVHAIGDRACREVLDAFAEGGPALRALRPRLEHAQILQPEDLARLGELGVVASMQPTHATADGGWARRRLGEGTARLAGAYACRSVARAGAALAFGSDFPVEDPDPRRGLHAAEVRRCADGTIFGDGERLTRAEALRAFTLGVAFAERSEGRRGAVVPGADADLTCFAEDVLAVPAESLPALPVTHTIVAGRVVFTRG
jgi:predicted amidohydrolase YtcJ